MIDFFGFGFWKKKKKKKQRSRMEDHDQASLHRAGPLTRAQRRRRQQQQQEAPTSRNIKPMRRSAAAAKRGGVRRQARARSPSKRPRLSSQAKATPVQSRSTYTKLSTGADDDDDDDDEDDDDNGCASDAVLEVVNPTLASRRSLFHAKEQARAAITSTVAIQQMIDTLQGDLAPIHWPDSVANPSFALLDDANATPLSQTRKVWQCTWHFCLTRLSTQLCQPHQNNHQSSKTSDKNHTRHTPHRCIA